MIKRKKRKNREKENVNRSETQIIRFLIKHNKQKHTSNYLKASAEGTSRATVSTEMHDGPVKSVKKFQEVAAINGNIAKKV